MSGDLRHINNVMNTQTLGGKNIVRRAEKTSKMNAEKETPLVHESCNFSGFSMAAVAGALLLLAGILLYAIVI